MKREIVLILAIISLGNVNNSSCAQAAWKGSEDCMDIVAQKTRFPTVVSQLVAGYVGYRVKKTFPPQKRVCVEHVMPDGRLVCVTRDGVITIRDLLTNKVLMSTQISREERETWCVTRPITSFGNDHIAIEFDAVWHSKMKAIDVFDLRTNQRIITYNANFNVLGEVDSIVLPLLEGELLIGYKRCNPIRVLTIGHGQRGIEGPGYDDIIRLPDNRLAAAREGKIMFSSIDAPLEMLPGHDLAIFATWAESFQKLMALSDGKLAVVSSQLTGSSDARLRVLDLTTRAVILRITFAGEEKIDVAALTDGDIAVKKQESGEIEVVYADGFREELQLGKKATTIQGLSNRDLFVKHPDGTKSLVTNKFEKRANIHVPQQGTFLRWLNRANAFPLVKE